MKPFSRNLLLIPLLLIGLGLNFGPSANAHHESGSLELYPQDAEDECVPGAMQIRVHVIGVTHEGIMKLDLYNSGEHFLNQKGKLRFIRTPAEESPQIVCIDIDEPGTYAVAGYHDIDGNRKLKKKWDFTPREPYGLSNNPYFESRRMPKFEEAAFEVGPEGIDIDFILVDLKARKKQRKLEKKQRKAAEKAAQND